MGACAGRRDRESRPHRLHPGSRRAGVVSLGLVSRRRPFPRLRSPPARVRVFSVWADRRPGAGLLWPRPSRAPGSVGCRLPGTAWYRANARDAVDGVDRRGHIHALAPRGPAAFGRDRRRTRFGAVPYHFLVHACSTGRPCGGALALGSRRAVAAWPGTARRPAVPQPHLGWRLLAFGQHPDQVHGRPSGRPARTGLAPRGLALRPAPRWVRHRHVRDRPDDDRGRDSWRLHPCDASLGYTRRATGPVSNEREVLRRGHLAPHPPRALRSPSARATQAASGARCVAAAALVWSRCSAGARQVWRASPLLAPASLRPGSLLGPLLGSTYAGEPVAGSHALAAPGCDRDRPFLHPHPGHSAAPPRVRCHGPGILRCSRSARRGQRPAAPRAAAGLRLLPGKSARGHRRQQLSVPAGGEGPGDRAGPRWHRATIVSDGRGPPGWAHV